jgi:transcriptional regulator with XRE-family HTH domain
LREKGKTLALGNRIKQLRNRQNISQTFLAEQIGLSHAYIGYLENGERAGSNKTLSKIANYFGIDAQDLFDLRDERITLADIPKEIESSNPFYIKQLIDFLMSIEEETREELVNKFIEQIQQKLYNLLTPFELKEIKQVVLDVKRAWMELVKNPTHQQLVFTDYEGYIRTDDKNVYIKLELNDCALITTLLHSDRKHIGMFEPWIGEEHAFFIDMQLLPHLNAKQKVIQFIWFSPVVSVVDRIAYLTNRVSDITQVQTSDSQLKMFL